MVCPSCSHGFDDTLLHTQVKTMTLAFLEASKKERGNPRSKWQSGCNRLVSTSVQKSNSLSSFLSMTFNTLEYTPTPTADRTVQGWIFHVKPQILASLEEKLKVLRITLEIK